MGFLAFRYIPTISNEIVQSRSNGYNSKCVCLNGHVGSNPTFSAILRGFCQVQEPRFSLGTHKFTTPARVLSDETFEFASKWEYVFAVVEKSLCPSHIFWIYAESCYGKCRSILWFFESTFGHSFKLCKSFRHF